MLSKNSIKTHLLNLQHLVNLRVNVLGENYSYHAYKILKQKLNLKSQKDRNTETQTSATSRTFNVCNTKVVKKT